MKKRISAVDLFCGAGGLTFGLARTGIDVRLGVDIEPSCGYPISHNTSAKFSNEDVTTIDAQIVADAFVPGTISLLAGCAPCQPFSTYARGAKQVADKRRGIGNKDDWKLVGKFGELIREIKPDLVTMENVPPLEKNEIFFKLLEDLEGYSVSYRVIECTQIGLPQARKRLVLVASRLGEIKIPSFQEQPVSVRDTIGALPSLAAGAQDLNDRMHRASKLSSINLDRIRASMPGGTWKDWEPSLRAACHQKESGATYPSVYGRMQWDQPAPTITTQCFGFGNGRFGHPDQDRAISLREAAMLQGFPKTYSFVPENKPISFSKMGKLIGNAVPVTLAEAIGRIFVKHAEAST